jgi:hypothetical protein
MGSWYCYLTGGEKLSLVGVVFAIVTFALIILESSSLIKMNGFSVYGQFVLIPVSLWVFLGACG